MIITKRNDVISIVTLSKVVAIHHTITNGEACDLITSLVIRHHLPVYDLSRNTLPQLFEDIDEGLDAVTEVCNVNWWHSSAKENLYLSIGRHEIRVNQVAILKIDAAKYCQIPIEKIDEWGEALTAYESSLTYEEKPVSVVVKRKDIINLVSLTKTIALHHQMTLPEACSLVTSKIFYHQLSVYSLQGNALPRLCEDEDAVCEVFNSYWWDNPSKESEYMIGIDMSPDEVAILKIDAAKYCEIPIEKIDDLLMEVSVKKETQSSDTKAIAKNTELQQAHISRELIILNKAAFEFWSTADPDDKTTHPTNDQVANWLKTQGYSDICAKQGAVIIRPEWATSGRRPTK